LFTSLFFGCLWSAGTTGKGTLDECVCVTRQPNLLFSFAQFGKVYLNAVDDYVECMKRFQKAAALMVILVFAVGTAAGLTIREPDLNVTEELENDSSEQNFTERIEDRAGSEDDGEESVKKRIKQRLERKTEQLKGTQETQDIGESGTEGFLSNLFSIF
jgi:hypothetical protein